VLLGVQVSEIKTPLSREDAISFASRLADEAVAGTHIDYLVAAVEQRDAASREQAFEHERSYLISCPWCGEQMGGRAVSQQFMHVIHCGDKRIAESSEQATKPLLEALRGIRSKLRNARERGLAHWPDAMKRAIAEADAAIEAAESTLDPQRGE